MAKRCSAGWTYFACRCLSQLACLNGPLISDEQGRLKYLTTFSFYFVQTFLIHSQLVIHLLESFDLSNITANLITLFTVKGFSSMNNELCNSFLQLMGQMTVRLCRMTVSSSSVNLIEDPSIAKETFDRLLQAWSRLLYGIDFARFEKLRPMAIEIFDTYLQSHLHVEQLAKEENQRFELTEDENEDEDDRDLFSEQLICIGLFGRHIIDYSLPLLVRLLVDRAKKFYQLMDQSSTNYDSQDLDRINDDLHWLLLITGHVLSGEYDSDEQRTIPDVLMQFSQEQDKFSQLNKSLQLAQHILQQPQVELTDELMQGVDSVTLW